MANCIECNERPVFAKSLCDRCYRRQWSRNNKPKVAEYSRRNREKHRDAYNARLRRWRKNNPAKSKAIYRRRDLKKSGTTPEAYARLYSKQNGCCKICGAFSKVLVSDHCHKTGLFRGLLCNRCNSAMGLFNDDPILIGKVQAYLSEARRD